MPTRADVSNAQWCRVTADGRRRGQAHERDQEEPDALGRPRRTWRRRRRRSRQGRRSLRGRVVAGGRGRARRSARRGSASSAPACAAARVKRSAVSRLRSRSGVDCNWTAAARKGSPWLTNKSIRPRSISCERDAAPQILALDRGLRARPDAVRRTRPRRRAAPLVVGGVGRHAIARGHARPVRTHAGGRASRSRPPPARPGRARRHCAYAGPCWVGRSTCRACSTSPTAVTPGGRRGCGRPGRG